LNVHIGNDLAGSDPAWLVVKELRLDYSLDDVIKHTSVQEGETLTLPVTALPVGHPPAFEIASDSGDAPRLVAWASGTVALTWATGRKSEIDCGSVPAPIELSGPWEVHFPAGWKAPEKVVFEHLLSWPEHSDPGVKYFSGTATYLKEFELPDELLGDGHQLWLDLGMVKNLAEVSLNGQPLGILWKPPFRLDVTAAAQAGTNSLEIKVTNLWPNRLIGDEQLPADVEWSGKRLSAWPRWLLDGKPSPTGRVTFTTWHHWTKTDNLLDSGLLGPVTLQPATETVIGNESAAK